MDSTLTGTTPSLQCFQSFIYAKDYTFIAITETWLQDNIYNNELLLTGYDIYRKDHRSKGGGVMLVVKSSIKSSQLNAPDNLEVVTVSVHAHQSYITCAVYTPPSSTFKTSTLTSVHLSLQSMSFLGDFNAPDINWETFASVTTTTSDCLCDFVIDHNLLQHVKEPTISMKIS